MSYRVHFAHFVFLRLFFISFVFFFVTTSGQNTFVCAEIAFFFWLVNIKIDSYRQLCDSCTLQRSYNLLYSRKPFAQLRLRLCSNDNSKLNA